LPHLLVVDLERGFKECEELARGPERLSFARADVLGDASESVVLGVVVRFGRPPEPDHERLHAEIVATGLKVGLKEPAAPSLWPG
jgi:hypothetical protein